ncbi:hypothetical protein [Sinorhizobium sp. CCBAU 05631]|uniref:hypothetical protein n=1 Tax=Sinorhizobium sp. CCBAU 05631 TaxID=794846 RepID=UPI0004ACAEAF|nr:hypothetical protein [Sinorhizobium sp. CCBAU 05631]ASY58304.1 hypothetical protein SS05631_c33900 [Sinorhizobium sp. CCBAU 05631]
MDNPNVFAFRLKPSRIDRVGELLADNQIAVGWSRAADLLQKAGSKEEFRSVLNTTYPDLSKRGRLGHDTNHVWRFMRLMKKGDIVIVPHGRAIHFLAVEGEVTLHPKKLNTDTVIRRDVRSLFDGKALSRVSLPSRLRKALTFRETSQDLTSVRDEVLALIGPKLIADRPLKAVESSTGTHKGISLWHKAFKTLGRTDHGYSEEMLWIEDLGIWLAVKGWERDGEHRHWNELGDKLGSRTTRNLIVEVNPPDGGKPGRWQGLVAKGSDGDIWLLHSGEMNVHRKRVQLRDHLAEGQLPQMLVRFSDGTLEPYFPVARLNADPLGVVRQTKKFMDVCLQVRTTESGADPAFTKAQRKAHLFEESIGQSFVPPQDAKLIDREHADVWHALRRGLEKKGFKVSNERVGALGPDLFTIEHDTPYLFEIKTSAGASDYLKAVGQLMVYEKALGQPHRKFLVIPPDLHSFARTILGNLEISIIEFSKTQKRYSFNWPHDL